MPVASTLDRQGTVTGSLFRPSVRAAVFDGGVGEAQVRHVALLDMTGDIDFLARVALANWASGARQAIFGRFDVAPFFTYQFGVDATGHLEVRHSTNGTATFTDASTVATGFAGSASAFHWVRATRVSATGVVTFYTAADSLGEPAVWAQLGATVNGTSGALFSSAIAADLGANASGTTNQMTGRVARLIVRDGSGFVHVDFSPSESPTSDALSTWVSTATVETWNLGGTTVLTEIDSLVLGAVSCGSVSTTTVTLNV